MAADGLISTDNIIMNFKSFTVCDLDTVWSAKHSISLLGDWRSSLRSLTAACRLWQDEVEISQVKRVEAQIQAS